MWALGIAGLVVVFTICVIFLIFAPSEAIFYPHKDYYDLSSICSDEFKEQVESHAEWADHHDACRSEGMKFEMASIFDGKWKIPNPPNIAVRAMYVARLGPVSVLKPTKSDTPHMRVMIPIQVPSENLNRCGIWVKGDFRPLDSVVMFDPNNMHATFNSRKMPATYIVVDLDRPKSISGITPAAEPV